MNKNPIPQGRYKPAVRYGNFVYTAGMTPRKDGSPSACRKNQP